MSSFGSPTAAASAAQQPSSGVPAGASPTANSPVHSGAVASGRSTALPRTEGGAQVPLSSLAPRPPQNSAPTSVSPTQRPSSTTGVPQKREIIELDDSDDNNDGPRKYKPLLHQQPSSPSTSRAGPYHLQPPFDPIPRSNSTPATNSGLNHASASASASPSIASLIHPAVDQPAKPQAASTGLAPPSLSVTNGRHIEPKPSAEQSARPAANGDSANRSPKAPSPKQAPPPSAATASTVARQTVPTGNGLLGSVLPVIGGGGGRNEEEPVVPNISIHVPLNGETNKYVNFSKLAEERYGWAALNPKLAKAREQMMLDSGDEMMMDGSESESNVEMGGTGDNGLVPPKRRKRTGKGDLYDKTDPFIDDSEMLWEEQAAASKDGFFVYSGPLVPEGEKPQIERADGTVKGARGRGRGRGRGSGTTRGGSTAAPRKPRVTKKEKEKMEKEKEERERFARMAEAVRMPPNH